MCGRYSVDKMSQYVEKLWIRKKYGLVAFLSEKDYTK